MPLRQLPMIFYAMRCRHAMLPPRHADAADGHAMPLLLLRYAAAALLAVAAYDAADAYYLAPPMLALPIFRAMLDIAALYVSYAAPCRLPLRRHD